MAFYEDMLDGSACSLCGSYFEDPVKGIETDQKGIHVHEAPVVCWDCWRNLSNEEKKMHSRSKVKTF